MDSDCEEVELIFEAEGKFWKIDWLVSSLSGWNSMTGISYGDNIKPENEIFEATEVKEVEVKTITWVAVDD